MIRPSGQKYPALHLPPTETAGQLESYAHHSPRSTTLAPKHCRPWEFSKLHFPLEAGTTVTVYWSMNATTASCTYSSGPTPSFQRRSIKHRISHAPTTDFLQEANTFGGSLRWVTVYAARGSIGDSARFPEWHDVMHV